MRFIYNIVRVVAANAKAAAARAKLAITEQISHFREKWEMADQSVTTQFGDQTTTTHYDQYGRPDGTTRSNAGGW